MRIVIKITNFSTFLRNDLLTDSMYVSIDIDGVSSYFFARKKEMIVFETEEKAKKYISDRRFSHQYFRYENFSDKDFQKTFKQLQGNFYLFK